MIISLIAALDESGGIGKAGGVPWHLRSDLQRFKRLTWGHHVIMGRKTWDSLGKPLPGRSNLVISRRLSTSPAGSSLVRSLAQALETARQADETEAFVIGGAAVFAEALPLAHRLYLTRVHTQANCDVFFPSFNMQAWRLLSSQDIPASAQDEFASSFEIYTPA